jgi:hypothetical protein
MCSSVLYMFLIVSYIRNVITVGIFGAVTVAVAAAKLGGGGRSHVSCYVGQGVLLIYLREEQVWRRQKLRIQGRWSEKCNIILNILIEGECNLVM